MVAKKTGKLLFANGGTLIYSLLYKLIAVGIVVLLLLPFSGLILSSVIPAIESSYSYMTSGLLFGGWGNFAPSVGMFFSGIADAVVAIFTINTFAGIYIIFVCCFVLPFFLNVVRIIVSESVYGYMSSLTKFGFFKSLLKRLGRASAYALYRTLVCIPINFVIMLGYLSMVNVYALSFAMPIITLVYFALTTAVKDLLFAGQAPAMIVFNRGVIKSFTKGFKVISKRLVKSFLYFFIAYLIFMGLMILLSVYCLIVLLPVCIFCLGVIEMLNFFEAQGMRYYISMHEIITPLKLEECDSFRKTKNII